MKRIYIGVALAAMAMFSSCENLQLQEPGIPEEEYSGAETTGQQFFTATIGEETKAYLEYDAARNVYKTVWAEDDYIYVMDAATGEFEVCPIIEGVGTTTAKFAGSLNANSYVAYYGSSVEPSKRQTSMYLSGYQSNLMVEYWNDETCEWEYEARFGNGGFPMVAESSTKDFSFQNLCSVLKVNVTTDNDSEYLYNFNIRTNDPDTHLSGGAYIDLSGNEPALDFEWGENEVYFSAWTSISSRGTSLYVVMPAQTYPGGFTIEVETDQRTKTFEVTGDVEMKRSRIRNLNVNLTGDTNYEVDEDWYVGVSNDDGNSWDNYQMSFDGQMYVIRDIYFESYAQIRFLEYNNYVYYGCPGYYQRSAYKTNTRIDLASGEDWYWFYNQFEGYYDLYIDPVEDCVYLMSSGRTPSDLPTNDVVVAENYDSIYDAGAEQIVKVHGTVMTKNANGFILAIDNQSYNNVYVYDPQNLYDVSLGSKVDLYGVTNTYRGMMEVVVSSDIAWYEVVRYEEYDYTAETPLELDPSDFSSYYYAYVRTIGTLNITNSSTGTYYNIVMDDQTAYQVSISSPVIDLAPYNGKDVIVEGYYFGVSSNSTTTFHNIVLKKISENNPAGGSTEEILPGGSITVN